MLAIRYTLERRWAAGFAQVCWIMLNPSSAEADPSGKDDPTIRRCISFSKRLGYDRLVVVNIYPFRTADPEELRRFLRHPKHEPGGDIFEELERNYESIREATADAETVIAAWGASAWDKDWIGEMTCEIGKQIYCLGTTKAGAPRHPLHVRGDQPLVEWRA